MSSNDMHPPNAQSQDSKIVRSDSASQAFSEGLTLHQSGQLSGARDAYLRTLALQPGHYEALHLLGVIAAQFENPGQAIHLIQRSLAINPRNAIAHANLANALKDSGQFRAAIESYDNAIALKPDYANAVRSRQMAIDALKNVRPKLVAPSLNDASAVADAGWQFSNGQKMAAAGRYDEAIPFYDRAIAFKPDFAEAYFNRGNVYNMLQKRQAALESYDRALSIRPDVKAWRYTRFATSRHVCAWHNSIAQQAELITAITHEGLAFFPFEVLSMTDSIEVQRIAAQRWIEQKFPAKPYATTFEKARDHEKIRIAYFSMDFCVHPVSILTAELFELHDRSRFEVYAFSYGPNTGDSMRRRLESAFDHFLDVYELTDEAIVELAHKLGIDIAVDLAGQTGSRTGIFAMRAAPVQVSYLGFPGTSGATYMDYLIADCHVIPPESEYSYVEKVAYLPSFQVNDRKREISDRVFTLDELGLPASGIVLCCFNKNYKFTTEIFACWMRILKRVDGSVLWLYAETDQVVTNLKQEASEQGIDPRRLIFGGHLPAAEYLARYGNADLFLDTFPFNAGTTASDALWAGLPVLTLAGKTFASRMGASLLQGVNLPELITSSLETYEDLAVELARHPERLKLLREKLAANRDASALFDTARFTQHIECAFAQMIDRHRASLPPSGFAVSLQQDS